jgi:hypothetical protein
VDGENETGRKAVRKSERGEVTTKEKNIWRKRR